MKEEARVYRLRDLVDAEDASPTSLFHTVNRLIPDAQVVLAVPPEMPAREAIELMRKEGFSQLPVVAGREVLGLFSYRAFALEIVKASRGRSDPADLPVEEFLEHDRAHFARTDDEFRGLIDVLDQADAVLVSGPDNLIAIVTPMDVLRYLHAVANAFVLIEEIELSLRLLFGHAVRDQATLGGCIANALTPRDPMPASLEELSFGDYLAIVRDGRNWPLFQPVLGGTRDRAAAKLESVRVLRNEVFHFRREITVEDHERLVAQRNWLKRCWRKVTGQARGER